MSNGAEDVAHRFQEKYGKDDETVLEAALTYIDRQGDLGAWEDHLFSDAPEHLWALFNEDSKPVIQKLDDFAPEGYTDDDAAAAFVRALEDGDSEAQAAVIQILKVVSEQSRSCVGIEVSALASTTGWDTASQLSLLIQFINRSPLKDACINYLVEKANEETEPTPIEVSDTVLVPAPVPNSDDIWEHEFEGTVIGFWDDEGTPMFRVRDQEDDVFDVAQHRLTKV